MGTVRSYIKCEMIQQYLKVGSDQLKIYIVNPRVSTKIFKGIHNKSIMKIKWNHKKFSTQEKAEKEKKKTDTTN